MLACLIGIHHIRLYGLKLSADILKHYRLQKSDGVMSLYWQNVYTACYKIKPCIIITVTDDKE